MPIHVAITRQVKAGCEVEFQDALREFFRDSFDHPAVLGASMIMPPPGSTSREFGILRTFQSARERDEFYGSPLFAAWDRRARALTEGEPVYRELHGLEAWFRSSSAPPPRWKMAVATFIGVFPVAMVLNLTIGRALAAWPFVLANMVFNACVVLVLTWLVMPFVTHVLRPWLAPGSVKEQP